LVEAGEERVVLHLLEDGASSHPLGEELRQARLPHPDRPLDGDVALVHGGRWAAESITAGPGPPTPRRAGRTRRRRASPRAGRGRCAPTVAPPALPRRAPATGRTAGSSGASCAAGRRRPSPPGGSAARPGPPPGARGGAPPRAPPDPPPGGGGEGPGGGGEAGSRR